MGGNYIMAYTNSSLATVKVMSPNHSGKREHSIDTITIHCVVGQLSAQRIGEIFLPKSRGASSNYGIGKDGDIGLYVEEKNRSWCSGGSYRVNGISGSENDHRAITIEVASDTTHPYAVTDKAYNSLINLVADICKRNDIKELKWQGDKSLVGQIDKQNMTVHRWFANKACPGDYLYDRHTDIANKVNKILGVPTPTPSPTPAPAPTPNVPTNGLKVGEIVNFKGTTHYKSASSDTPLSCKPGEAKVTAIAKGTKHPYHLVRTPSGGSTVYGWVNAVDIAESNVPAELKVGDKVKLSSSATVYGKTYKFASWVYTSVLYVRAINGDKVTISTLKEGAVTGNVDKKYLTKV